MLFRVKDSSENIWFLCWFITGDTSVLKVRVLSQGHKKTGKKRAETKIDVFFFFHVIVWADPSVVIGDEIRTLLSPKGCTGVCEGQILYLKCRRGSLRNLHKRNKTMCLEKDLYANVFRNIMCKSKNGNKCQSAGE